MHWSKVAEDIGFKGVMAGPLVRSSYRAGKLYATAMKRWGRPVPEHLSHLAAQADAGIPARQEAASLVDAADAPRAARTRTGDGVERPAAHVS